jgi:hypothetical protein
MRHGRGSHREMMWRGHRAGPPETSHDELAGWCAGRLPDGWFTGSPEITFDREEILVMGTLPEPELDRDASDAAREAARESRIDGWREDTREQRIRIAQQAEQRFGRTVSWGAECGGTRKLFTTLAAPFMTRLRMPEREVLDTLVKAGVARSRSHALAWCVRLVGEHQADWIAQLKEALENVEQARAGGPVQTV